MSNKITIDDIFEDDEFGLLNALSKTTRQKSTDGRLVDSFEEVNQFIDRTGREPSSSSISEYGLYAKLKTFRQNDSMKRTLKPFDRYDLLGHIEMEELSIDDILNDDNDFGLLDTDKELSIFKLKNVPKDTERSDTDTIAQRKPMKESEFLKYESMFQQVHKEIRAGKRKLLPMYDSEKNLIESQFYIIDGVMYILKKLNLAKEM